MKKTILLALLTIIFVAHADEEENTTQTTNRLKHYVSAAYGNGEASEGGDMEWRTFELRIGSSLAPGRRVDVVHYNEGHPVNNHRDGFAIEAMYDVPVNEKIKLELGAGPYLSFNTTSRDAKQYDDKHLGILASAVVLYYLNVHQNNNLHVRLDYNHVHMPGEHPSDAVLLGVGMNFGEQESSTSEKISEDPIEISVMGANFKTNRNGTDAALGGVVELKQYEGEHFALSVSLIEEGTDALVKRAGVAFQAWYVLPASESWSLSTGAGPYLVEDRLDSYETRLDGLISLDVQRHIGNLESGRGLLVRFSRIVSDDHTDRDIFAIGFAQKF